MLLLLFTKIIQLFPMIYFETNIFNGYRLNSLGQKVKKNNTPKFTQGIHIMESKEKEARYHRNTLICDVHNDKESY